MRVKPGLPGKDRMTRSLHIEVDNTRKIVIAMVIAMALEIVASSQIAQQILVVEECFCKIGLHRSLRITWKNGLTLFSAVQVSISPLC